MRLNDRIQLARQIAHNRLFEEYDRLKSIFKILETDIENILADNDPYDRADERFQAAFRHLNRCHGLMFTKQQLTKLMVKKKRKIGKNPVSKERIKDHTGTLTKLVRAWSVFGLYRGTEEEHLICPYDVKQVEALQREMDEDEKRHMLLEQGRMIRSFNLIPRNSFSSFILDVANDRDLDDQNKKFSDLILVTHDTFVNFRGNQENYEFPKNLKIFDRYVLLQYLEECYRQHKAYLRDQNR